MHDLCIYIYIHIFKYDICIYIYRNDVNQFFLGFLEVVFQWPEVAWCLCRRIK